MSSLVLASYKNNKLQQVLGPLLNYFAFSIIIRSLKYSISLDPLFLNIKHKFFQMHLTAS